jgi:hypothetical protein
MPETISAKISGVASLRVIGVSVNPGKTVIGFDEKCASVLPHLKDQLAAEVTCLADAMGFGGLR